MRRLVWQIQAVLFYLGTWLLALVPERFSRRAGELLGLAMCRLLKRRRRIAEDNIAASLAYMRQQPEWNCTLPDAPAIARETFASIGRSLVETCRLYHNRGGEMIARVEVRGREHYEAAQAQGKGLIFLTGHCGNWELGALAFSALFNAPMAVVARRQDNPYLNRMVEQMRMSYRNSIIYKDNALRMMLSVLRKKGVIGMLVDQAVASEEGSLVTFLGRPAWASRAPVVLARKTGAPILPAFIHRDGDRHVIEFEPALAFSADSDDAALQADVQRYSACIERFIVRHPTDWYWVHRRWKRTEGL